MSKKEQTIQIRDLDTDTALAISYEVFKQLGWLSQFAGPDKLLGSTPKKWNNYPQQIIIGVAGNELHISSTMMNNAAFDLAGKNNKNLAAFTNAFETIKNNVNDYC